MERIVKQVVFRNPIKKLRKRVAAYARVSCGKDAMLHSLSAQVSYYSELIQSHSDWLYCGVYADEALTGTKDSRENFQKLLTECRNGNIDIVITKSISRFARNTVTLLETVRELKSLNVDVFFEEQNIHSLSADGELMLTILASYAQEESLSASENQKWKIRKDFEQGKVSNVIMLGYRRNNEGVLEIIPQEAQIVEFIFRSFICGTPKKVIANTLNEMKVKTRLNCEWSLWSIDRVLKNEKYTGNLLLQKTYRENHITKKKMKNNGELPQYYVEESHPAIISEKDFNLVQSMIKHEMDRYTPEKTTVVTYPFTGMIKCGCCGKNYRRRTTATGINWICRTYNNKGKKYCPDSKQIPEVTLISKCCEVLEISEFDEEKFAEKIKEIIIPSPNKLRFIFNDGHEIDAEWKDRSRSESWTPEMKEKARLDGCRRK